MVQLIILISVTLSLAWPDSFVTFRRGGGGEVCVQLIINYDDKDKNVVIVGQMLYNYSLNF